MKHFLYLLIYFKFQFGVLNKSGSTDCEIEDDALDAKNIRSSQFSPILPIFSPNTDDAHVDDQNQLKTDEGERRKEKRRRKTYTIQYITV